MGNGNGDWTFTISVTDSVTHHSIANPTYTDGSIAGSGNSQGVIKVQYPDSIAEVMAMVSAASYGPQNVPFGIDDDGGSTVVELVSLQGPVGSYPGKGSGW
jgi:hypothetical protein